MLVLFYDFFILITKFRLKTLYLAELEQAAANEIKKSKYPVPDITQMLPFKPIRNACKNILINLISNHLFKLTILKL